MKVLTVVEATDGGVVRHAVDLSAEFGKHDHDIHILYSPKRVDPGFVEELECGVGGKLVAVEINRPPGLTGLAVNGRIRRYMVGTGAFDTDRGKSREFGHDRMIEETLAVNRKMVEASRAPAAMPLAAKENNHQRPAPNQR